MLPLDAPRAACADRLDLVDEAIARSRGRNSMDRQRRAISKLHSECCDVCPIRRECRLEGRQLPTDVRGAFG